MQPFFFSRFNWSCYFQIKYFYEYIYYFILFWPLAASMRSEVKNDYANDTMQAILNKIIELKFSLECVTWLWCWLFQLWLPVKILIRWECFFLSNLSILIFGTPAANDKRESILSTMFHIKNVMLSCLFYEIDWLTWQMN